MVSFVPWACDTVMVSFRECARESRIGRSGRDHDRLLGATSAIM